MTLQTVNLICWHLQSHHFNFCNLHQFRLPVPKNDKLLKKKYVVKTLSCLGVLTQTTALSWLNYHIFPDYVTGQYRQNLLSNKHLVMLYTGSLKAHHLQGNLNYTKCTTCHTVGHLMYAPLTQTVTPSQELIKMLRNTSFSTRSSQNQIAEQ